MTLPRKWPNNKKVLNMIKNTVKPVEGQTYLVNRNPRNLEFLRIAHKPLGYQLDKHGKAAWNKLSIVPSGKYVSAQMIHFESPEKPVIEASTNEWAIKKQLYKTNDTSAYYNLARVFAQRCLEAGFVEMHCNIRALPGGKVWKFIKTLKENGLVLKEPAELKSDITANHFVGRKEKPHGDWQEF